MTTTVGNEESLTDLLKNLRTLDLAASEAYTDAIQHLDDPEAQAQLTAFKADHIRHASDLGQLLQELGEAGDIPQTGGLKSLWTQGKVLFASLGGDRQILQAMSSNEADTNIAYERAVQHMAASGELLAVLQRNLADERRHKQWIDSRMAQLARAA
jgi:rubrerythrin